MTRRDHKTEEHTGVAPDMRRKKKGPDLERAIELIESAILKAAPHLLETAYKIYSRKIIVVDDVRHEIDIWVEFDKGNGYESLFIFEAKNWRNKIGKNHVIVFSEKIRAARAQRGFFVAKRFTKYAIAAAKNDRRVTLLKVNDEFDNGEIISRFHNIVCDRSKAVSEVQFFGEGSSAGGTIAPFDIGAVTATIDGRPIDLNDYVSYHIVTNINECLNGLPTHRFADGSYTYTVRKDFVVSAQALIVNGVKIQKFSLRTTFTVEVVRPPIVSKYEVDTRGRVYTFDLVQVGGQFASQLTLVEHTTAGLAQALIETFPAVKTSVDSSVPAIVP